MSSKEQADNFIHNRHLHNAQVKDWRLEMGLPPAPPTPSFNFFSLLSDEDLETEVTCCGCKKMGRARDLCTKCCFCQENCCKEYGCKTQSIGQAQVQEVA